MSIKKLLITGFEPFDGQSINPSWEAVSRLPDKIGEYTVTKLRIPVEFSTSAECVIEKAEEISPDVILCVGQAGGRGKICFERIGVNVRNASIADNAGVKPTDELIVKDGREAFFSTVANRQMVDAVKEKGIACAMSYHAGAYVCNDVLYTLLHRFNGTDTKVGFIHVPYLPEQTSKGEPCMELDEIVAALNCAIEAL